MAGNGEQLNKVLGANTVQFHIDGTMPNPGAADINQGGGTPNQKTERWANRIALYHFVQPDAGKAKQALAGTIDLFEGQVARGHQCVGDEDEALTLSHAPIWWRAILSLRITSNRLAGRGSDYAHLEQLVLDWLEHHTSLNALGQITSGPKQGEIWVPGARTKLGNGNGNGNGGGKKTDKVTNVIHQLMTTGTVTTQTGPKFFNLDQDDPDRAGAALARTIKGSIGFGNVTGGSMPTLRNRLVFERFDDGHIGRYPDGIVKDNGHVQQAWAQYSTGQIDCSKQIEPLPATVQFTGTPRTREIAQA
jgi:hypothetical protein